MSGHRPETQSSRRRGKLLFVDEDEFLLEMLSSALTLSRPRWSVIATRDPAEALDALQRDSELDAIVTEIIFDRTADRGRAFIREVAQRWPEVPVLTLTTLDRDEVRSLDTAEYIAKPPDIDYLVSRIDRILRRQRESQVRGISLTTFLQILEIDQKTCTVYVSHGGQQGEIGFRQGKLVHARFGARDGKEALFAMLSMSDHTLRVIDGCTADSGTVMPLASLLMEWSVREDHSKRDDGDSREESE